MMLAQETSLGAATRKLFWNGSTEKPPTPPKRSAYRHMSPALEELMSAPVACSEVQLSQHKYALREGDVPSRYHAAEHLAKIGRVAKRVSPELRKVLRSDESALVRKSAAYALGSIGAEDAVADLRHAVHCDEDPYVRREAASVLELLGFFADCSP